MNDKTTITQDGEDEMHIMWYKCDECGSIDITDWYVYCPMCGKKIIK